MELIDYLFGLGDGETHRWSSLPDLNLGGGANNDAVRLDFDGDGRIDDALYDFNYDGRADYSALDLNDDGVVDTWFTDDGKGTWAQSATDPRQDVTPAPPAEAAEFRYRDLSGKEHITRNGLGDLTGDGSADDVLRDLNGDGRADVGLVGNTRMYQDTNGDGLFDQLILDSDNDGTADTVLGPDDDGYFREKIRAPEK